MSADGKKPEEEVSYGEPEILDGEDLEELHGGASFSGPSSRFRRPGGTFTVGDEFETAYGGEGNDILGPIGGVISNPLKR